MLGIAFSSLPRSSRARHGRGHPGALLVLQFISGVFFVFDELPPGCSTIGASSRSSGSPRACARCFYPADFASAEMAGSWETGRTSLVLLAWAVGGLVLCVLTFKWFKRGTT